MRGLGLLRREVKARPAGVTLAAIATSLMWSERSMRRALREGGRIPPYVVEQLKRLEASRREAARLDASRE